MKPEDIKIVAISNFNDEEKIEFTFENALRGKMHFAFPEHYKFYFTNKETK